MEHIKLTDVTVKLIEAGAQTVISKCIFSRTRLTDEVHMSFWSDMLFIDAGNDDGGIDAFVTDCEYMHHHLRIFATNSDFGPQSVYTDGAKRACSH
jgi:hypothetical protein